MPYTLEDIDEIVQSGNKRYRYTAQDMKDILDGQAGFSNDGVYRRPAPSTRISEVRPLTLPTAASAPITPQKTVPSVRPTVMPLRTDVDMDRARDTAARAAALIRPRTLPKAGAALPSAPPAYQPGQNQLALPTASKPLVSPTGMIGSTGIRLPSAKPAQQRVPVGNTGVRLPAIAGESEYKGALAVPSRPEGAPIATAGKWVARNTMAGIGAVNSGLAKTADMILPDVITPGPIQKVINRYKGETDRYQPAAQEINRATGTEMLGSLYQGTVAALPNAAMAVMSSGTSAAPQLGPQAAGLMSTISTSLKQLARNPMFWTSFAQTSGATYEDAKEQGASELEAQATALISGVLNAGVEVGGGIETFGQNGTGVSAWVRTMLDEGKEEVVQGAIEQLTKKAVYRPELPYYSAENPEAVINLPRAAQEFGGGAAVGGILGGGQIMAGAALGALRGTGIETDAQTVRPDPNPEMRGIMAEEFGRGNAIRETYEPQTPLLPAGAQMENGRIVLQTAAEAAAPAPRTLSTARQADQGYDMVRFDRNEAGELPYAGRFDFNVDRYLDMLQNIETPEDYRTFRNGIKRQMDDLDAIRGEAVDAYADYIYGYRGQGVSLQPTFNETGETVNRIRVSNNEPWYSKYAGRRLSRADARALAERVVDAPRMQADFPEIVPRQTMADIQTLSEMRDELHHFYSSVLSRDDFLGAKQLGGQYSVYYGDPSVAYATPEGYNRIRGRSLKELDIASAPWEEINLSPEIQRARARAKFDEPTVSVSTPERAELRLEIADKLYALGSFAGKDPSGKEMFSGPVTRGRHADIVIGPPAAGKSSVFANALSRDHQARIIDSDMAKTMLPEFDGGYGAGRVHKESDQIITDLLLPSSTKDGENIVLPLVGKNTGKIRELARSLKAQGYTVNLYLNDLPVDKAARRAVTRFMETGRFVDPDYVLSIGSTPNETYDILRREGLFDEYVKKSNDVARGEPPVLLDQFSNSRDVHLGGLHGLGQGQRQIQAGRVGRNDGGSRNSGPPEAPGAAGTGAPGADGQVSPRAIQDAIPRDDSGYGPHSIGAAESGGRPTIDELIDEYGTLRKGEQPRAREVELPKETREGRVSRFAQNAAESAAVDEGTVDTLKSEIEAGTFAYVPIGDKSAVDYANRRIEQAGTSDAIAEFHALANSGKRLGKNDIALGERLIQEAAASGDYDTAVRLIADVATVGSEMGQAVQAMRILKRLTPEGNLRALNTVVNRINSQQAAKGKPPVHIPQENAVDILSQKTREGLEGANARALKAVAEQMPATWFDKWNAWRYLSMLSSPRTHIRNVLGNAVFIPARKLKNLIGTGIEHMAVLPDAARTKAVITPKDKPLVEFAKADSKKPEIRSAIMGTGKMNPADVIRDERTIFNTKWLEAARKGNTTALDVEDQIFSQGAYADALAQVMKARNLTPEFLQSGTKNANAALEEARKVAIREAQRATYRDASKVADALNRFSRTNTATALLTESVLPFKKTPINILKRGVEYSPIGLVKGLTYDLGRVRSEQITATQAIDNIAAGLSGTAIMALGAWLSHMGLLTGGGSDDRKENSFDRLQGGQTYALKIGDKTYTIDWMAPVSLPLFVGAEAYGMAKSDDPGMSFTQFLDAASRITEPMLNLSMLDGLNSSVRAVAGSESPITDFLLNAAGDYISQGVPSALGQAARSVDGTRRNSYYVDKNSPLPKFLQLPLQKNMAKIPGVSKLLPPNIDQWGRESEQKGAVQRTVENFLSPGYLATARTTPADKVVSELYEATGDKTVLPGYAQKYFSVDGKRIDLTAKQYTEYSKVRGQAANQLVGAMGENPIYGGLSNEDKTKAVQNAYAYANAVGKAAVSDYEPDGWIAKAQEAAEKGVPVETFILYRAIADADGNDSVTQQEAARAIEDISRLTRLTPAQKRAIYHAQNAKWKNNPF